MWYHHRRSSALSLRMWLRALICALIVTGMTQLAVPAWHAVYSWGCISCSAESQLNQQLWQTDIQWHETQLQIEQTQLQIDQQLELDIARSKH